MKLKLSWKWLLPIIFAVLFIAPATVGLLNEKWTIDAALANAKSIRLEQFRSTMDMASAGGREQIISSKNLTPDEMAKLRGAFPPVLDIGIPGVAAECIFNPHHRIIITDAKGNRTVVAVCFECDHVGIAHGYGPMSEIFATPFVWQYTLRNFFAAEGMPNSPQLYRPPAPPPMPSTNAGG